MGILKVRNQDGTINEIPALVGPKGEQGSPGKTPVKGTDYWTETDKSEIVEQAASLVRIPARNLLDNSDFTNPVNQRGNTTYTGVYGIDRWRTWGEEAVTITNSGISIMGNLYQYFNKTELKNVKCTLAVKKKDGTILTHTQNLLDDLIYSTVNIGFGTDPATNSTKVVISLPTGEYVWAALYEGEYTAETLPPYVPKGYGAELAECQRYYQVFSQNETHLYGNSGDVNGNAVRLVVPNTVKMRINPTVSAFNIAVLSGERISNYETTYTPSNCNSENGFLSFYGKVSPPIGIESYTYRAIIAQLRNTKLEVSADL